MLLNEAVEELIELVKKMARADLDLLQRINNQDTEIADLKKRILELDSRTVGCVRLGDAPKYY